MNTAKRVLSQILANAKSGWVSSKWYVKLSALSVFVGSKAFAYTAPVAGDAGFLFYDTIVNSFLKSGVGFAVCLSLIIISGSKLNTHTVPSVAGILIGSALMKADELLVSFGALLPHNIF